jgi:hypothetical protein
LPLHYVGQEACVIYADALLKILSLYFGRLGYKLVDILAYLLRTARRCTMFVVMLLKEEKWVYYAIADLEIIEGIKPAEIRASQFRAKMIEISCIRIT